MPVVKPFTELLTEAGRSVVVVRLVFLVLRPMLNSVDVNDSVEVHDVRVEQAVGAEVTSVGAYVFPIDGCWYLFAIGCGGWHAWRRDNA